MYSSIGRALVFPTRGYGSESHYIPFHFLEVFYETKNLGIYCVLARQFGCTYCAESAS